MQQCKSTECGESPDDARFCIDCGEPLAATGPTTVLPPLAAARTSTHLATVYIGMPPLYAEVSVLTMIAGFLVAVASGMPDPEAFFVKPAGSYTMGLMIGLGVALGSKTAMRKPLLPVWGGFCAMIGWALYVTFYVLMKLVWP